jgi:hypothetical protein
MSHCLRHLKSFWETTLDDVVVGDNHPIQLRTDTSSAIIDTGTTAIVGDENDVKEIYALIAGSLPADPKYDLGEGYFTSSFCYHSASPVY